MNKTSVVSCLLLLISGQSYGQEELASNAWTPFSSSKIERAANDKQHHRIYAKKEFTAELAIEQLAVLSGRANQLMVSVPLPTGKMVTYQLKANTALAQGLTAKYPELKTYDGYQVDDPTNVGKFELTPAGLRGMFYDQGRLIYLDPKYLNNDRIYTSYYKSDAVSQADQRITLKAPINNSPALSSKTQETANTEKLARTPVALREYRLAITTTGEYTQFHGSVSNVMTELATLVNRMNMIYEQELAVRMSLVANNEQLIFTDAATDPFQNELDNDSSEATQVISERIGAASYDVGHVLTTDGGGLAFLGAVCRDSIKGGGASGSSRPVGDSFHVDLVAHELGHQFGANHTFNGLTGACNGNRSASSSYEVGSGSTIMAYAGICGSQNLQRNADPVFHGHSMDEINSHLGRFTSCGSSTEQSNRTPVAEAGNNFTIPANTPFTLTGSGSDQDNDTLTYDWQQFDLGPGSNGTAEQIDDGQRPLFRAFAPKDTASRTFPQISDVLSGSLTLGETYATTNRDLNFRLIVRDNKGGVASDNTVVTVVDTGEAFSVAEPSAGSSWTVPQQTIRWNVAQTDQTPISCPNVAIDLSLDGGANYTISLAQSTPNDGSFDVELPAATSTDARLRISCINNVFFAVNSGNFSVNSQGLAFAITGLITPLSVNEDESLSLSVANFIVQGRVANSITVAAGDNYTVSNNQVTPSANFNGQLQVNVTANAGAEQTPTFVAQVTVNPVNDAPVANNDTLTINQDAGQQTIDVVGNDTDIDANDTLTLSTINYSGTGQASIVNNQISYTPASGFNGTETINYTISDSANSNASATLTITVNAPAPAPAPTPNPTPAPAASSDSGGGAAFWLALLVMFGLRYSKRKY
ncbi:cadherin-like domain-containing protein [Endozoicomonas sp. G2_1]|uniref:reprolysin-like metallopeptidase n=1 Tax=Endozoicomonas sp. G2_1 TaxID=2821091 RepID=UPI001AD9BDB1|nr:zinc-dependent metalloprotease family protein [Endozoicomonas sp. G2_1]MBO9491281.1 cadherin-like domain-containing protein [Endozoicomonas sp. G2_1]